MANITSPVQKSPWRLRTRLSVALVAIFAAVFALVVISHYQNVRDRRDSRVESMESVGQTAAAVFEGFRHDLESFALSTAITLGDARLPIDQAAGERGQPSVGPYLKHLADSYGILRAIFVTDTAGRVVYAQDDGSRGVDLSGRDYIQALQRGEEEFWSNGLVGLQSGTTTVAYAKTIVSPEGQTTGYLVIAFYPSQLATRLPESLTSSGGHVTLFDSNGLLLMRLPGDEAPAGSLYPEWPALREATDGQQVVLRNEDIPAVEGDRYGALVPLPELNWVVGYTLSKGAIEGNTTALFQRDLLVLAGLLVVALAGLLFLANRVSQPLTRLVASAGEISRGDYSGDLTQIKNADAEIAVLASTMAEMQQTIRVREQRLENQSAVLESLERIGESLAGRLELSDAVRAVAATGVEVTGAETVVFLERNDDGRGFAELGRAGRKTFELAGNDSALAGVMAGDMVSIPDVGASSSENGSQQADAPDIRSLLAAPVVSRSGEMSGALVFLHSRPEAFNQLDNRLVDGVVRWAGIVLENATLYQRSQEMSEELRQASVAKDEFLAIVAHELRTPITTIYGGSRLLRMRRDKLPPEAIQDMFDSIAEEAERLYLLVEDLLAIARTEMSEAVEREPVPLQVVVDHAIANFSRTHDRPVETRIAPDLPAALAEPTYMTQVLTNLISNADKYSPPDSPIEVEVVADEAGLTVRVKDHGQGVAEPELEQIFDRFYRSADAAERAGGKGLGLTVCKRLVEALSGRIWAQNRPDGSGLIVSFTLQAAEAPQPTPELTSPAS